MANHSARRRSCCSRHVPVIQILPKMSITRPAPVYTPVLPPEFLTTQTASTKMQDISFSGQISQNGSETRERLHLHL
jgi:hypothetical protein